MTRCKVGDIAVITNADNKNNIGKFVTCEKYLGHIPVQGKYGSRVREAWHVSGNATTWNGAGFLAVPDEWLKPIRDNDGEDEMLRIAGKPAEKKEHITE